MENVVQGKEDRLPKGTPSPAVIADMCKAIQATWSEEEKQARMFLRPLPYQFPVYPCHVFDPHRQLRNVF